MDPQEEAAIGAVTELLAIQDIAIALEQETRHFRDNAASIGAGNGQDKFGRAHGFV
jgi:hypothetical protein